MYFNVSNKKAQYIYLYIAIALIQLAAYLLNHTMIEGELLHSFWGVADSQEIYGRLGLWLWKYTANHPAGSLCWAAITLILSTFLLEQHIVKYNLTGDLSLTPIMLLSCYAVSIGANTPPLISSLYLFAMLCAVCYTIKRRNETRSTSSLLLCAFMIGVLPLIYSAAILSFLMLIPIKIMLTNRDRDWITLLIGFFTPTLLALHLDYLINNVGYMDGIANIYESILTPSRIPFSGSQSGVIMVLFGCGATIYSILRINKVSLPAISRIYLIIYALWVGVALVMISLPSFSVGVLTMLSVPFTIFTSQMLSTLNRWYSIALAITINLVALCIPILKLVL